MIITLNRRLFLAGATAMTVASPAFSSGTTHEVKMLNKHPDNKKLRNVFLPLLLVIQPGDTVTFLPTDKGHNSASIKGMIPEAAEPWKSKINKEFSVTFDVPGVYGYKCTPHFALGMVGMIIVEGESMKDNAEAARGVKQSKKSQDIFDGIWAEVDEKGMLEPSG